jgi:hypothetical protein
MILLSVPSRGCSHIQKLRMAARLRCPIDPDWAFTSPFNLRMEKAPPATRPRGNQLRRERYISYACRKKYSRICLNLICIVALTSILFSRRGAGRFVNHQPAIQEGILSFTSHLVGEPNCPKRAGSQCSGYPKLLSLFFSALFAWVSSGIITALAPGLSRDQRPPRSLIVHHFEHSRTQDRADFYRTTFPNSIISCLEYLALGVFAALLLRSSGAHPEEPDFYLAGVHHIQQLYQEIKTPNLHIFAAILIAPLSSDQIILQTKILNRFLDLFKIGAVLEMDLPNSNPCGVYQPIKHRLAEDEALTLRDLESDVGDNTGSRNNEKEVSPEVATALGTSNTTWTPDPEHNPSDKFSQARMKAKLRAEADGIAVLRNFYPTASSSNTTSPVGTTTRDLGSTYLDLKESISSLSSVPNRNVIRKAKSGIFKQGSSQDDAEVPPMPNQNRLPKATSTIFRSNKNRKEDAPSAADNLLSKEESSKISPEPRGSINLIRVRNLGIEALAKAMGFDLPQNRFGLPEEFVGNSTLLTECKIEVSLADGTVAGLATSEDDYDCAEDKGTVSEEAETISGVDEPRSPLSAPERPVTETGDGLVLLEYSPSDSMSWLTDGFASSELDLLKDFGTPPKVTSRSPGSSLSFNMPPENRNGLQNLGAPPKIGNFGTYGAEQVQNSGLGHSQPEQDNANEINKLRGEIRRLVEKYLVVCEVKDSEIRSIKASEAAALERVKVLELILGLHGIYFEAEKELSENDNAFDLATNTCGVQQTPTKSGFTSTSKDSTDGHSSGSRSSHKKSKSQEGGFFKSLIGTTEPPLAAFEKLKERSLLEVNADERDPNLAAKLKISPRKLPPEAPKPASKAPVPKSKSGTTSMLKRLSSLDNLGRKDAPGSSSSESKNYSSRNDSQNSYSSQSKDASLTSITEESSGGSKSPGKWSGPSQRHSRSSRALTGQYDSDLDVALAAISADRSHEQGSGAILQGWEHKGVSRGSHEECDEHDSIVEEHERPTGERHVSQTTSNTSEGPLVHHDRANIDGERGDQVLRSNPPSRSPPARPGLPAHPGEGHMQHLERQEGQEEQPNRVEVPTTPDRFNLNKSLPEINSKEVEKEESRKDGKKRGLRNLFTRK